MTNIKCDLCGKRLESTNMLYKLYEDLCTDEVKEICADCNSDITDANRRADNVFRKATNKITRKYIRLRRKARKAIKELQ